MEGHSPTQRRQTWADGKPGTARGWRRVGLGSRGWKARAAVKLALISSSLVWEDAAPPHSHRICLVVPLVTAVDQAAASPSSAIAAQWKLVAIFAGWTEMEVGLSPGMRSRRRDASAIVQTPPAAWISPDLAVEMGFRVTGVGLIWGRWSTKFWCSSGAL
ncbi:hypothetical protein ACLOJK_000109, partial [Asimina triloba]